MEGIGLDGAGELDRNTLLLEVLLGGRRPVAAPAPEAVKAIAWARVSTDLQEERGLSLPEQLREIRAFASTNGYEIVAEYCETSSAFHHDAKRAEFHRMLDATRGDPRIGAILVHDYSRFSRNRAASMHLVRDLRRRGVRIISLSDPEIDPTTVAGVYAEAIILAKNEAYSREVALHTGKGLRANIQTRDEETGWCYKNGGLPTFGYRAEYLHRGPGRGGKPIVKRIWLPDETMAAGRPLHEWARHCLVELAAKGVASSGLCDFCDGAGIPPRRASRWNTTTWDRLLGARSLLTYCGYGVWNVRDRPDKGRSPSEWLIVPAAHPALITEEEARAIAGARARLRGLGYGWRASNLGSPYLMSGGLFTCGQCGATMVGTSSGSWHYYMCRGQLRGRVPEHRPSASARKEHVESAAIAGVEDFLLRYLVPGRVAGGRDAKPRRLRQAGTVLEQQMAREREGVERRLANLCKAISDGLCDTAWASARLQELLARREALAEKSKLSKEALEAHLQQFRRAFSPSGQASVIEKRELLRASLDSAVLVADARRLEITCRLPTSIVGHPLPSPMGPAGSDAEGLYHATLSLLLPFGRYPRSRRSRIAAAD